MFQGENLLEIIKNGDGQLLSGVLNESGCIKTARYLACLARKTTLPLDIKGIEFLYYLIPIIHDKTGVRMYDKKLCSPI